MIVDLVHDLEDLRRTRGRLFQHFNQSIAMIPRVLGLLAVG
jgi:hypothetical protein